MQGYSDSGAAEPELLPIDSNEDGFCRRGGGFPTAHGRLHLGTFVVEVPCFGADLNHLIKWRGFQVSDRESPRHAGVASSHVGHTHDVIENAGYPAAMYVTGRALKGLAEPHRPRNSIRRLLPE